MKTEPNAQEQLEELRGAVLDDWLLLMEHLTRTQREMQNTLSWRITKPLRVARVLQLKANEIGVVPTAQLTAAAVARRVGRPR